MKRIVLWACAGALAAGMTPARAEEEPASGAAKPTNETKEATSVHDFEVQTIDGKTVKLEEYKGNVCLIVNVASKCGLTERNYQQLEPLYQKYKDQGFRILAFPANNFGAQEPGTNQEIKQFCTTKYHASYDLFAKVSVKGEDICPLYKYLTEHPDAGIAGEITWNFQKYLVDRAGRVIAKFDPRVDPSDEKLTTRIEQALAEPPPATNTGA